MNAAQSTNNQQYRGFDSAKQYDRREVTPHGLHYPLFRPSLMGFVPPFLFREIIEEEMQVDQMSNRRGYNMGQIQRDPEAPAKPPWRVMQTPPMARVASDGTRVPHPTEGHQQTAHRGENMERRGEVCACSALIDKRGEVWTCGVLIDKRGEVCACGVHKYPYPQTSLKCLLFQ